MMISVIFGGDSHNCWLFFKSLITSPCWLQGSNTTY